LDQQLYDLAADAGRALQGRGWMLVTAESCTGGWIAQCVTMVPGSSEWFERGFVTYTNVAKAEMLGVLDATLRENGAVSEQTVREMAAGALRRSHAQVAVAVSGVAGPGGGSPDKPVGTVCLAWAVRDGRALERTVKLPGDRDAVRRQSVVAALEGVRLLALSSSA
jgi:nicotinamide-nucleotide amidase